MGASEATEASGSLTLGSFAAADIKSTRRTVMVIVFNVRKVGKESESAVAPCAHVVTVVIVVPLVPLYKC